MNNNSRKNINKNTSKANKASKKKFKIESLEPRLGLRTFGLWPLCSLAVRLIY